MAIATDDTLLQGLNPAQREAVLHVDGPLLVLAGAGSGKTRVLTTRLARLIDHDGVDPSRILAVTFTNKAAGEMKARIGRLLGRAPVGMWVGTFHAIGARMLRAAPQLVGLTPSFTIYDQDDAQTVVKRIMERHRINTKQFTPRGVHSAISDAKNRLVYPSEFANLAMDPFARAIATVYNDYGEELRRANATDFDDLLLLPVQMLAGNPQELEKYQRRFRYILVDEYQDTNRAQYQLVKHLAGGHENLCVVGDDDQSIYGWRGADIRNILDFKKDFPVAHVVRLEQNYRSTPEVLELANVVISANAGRMGKTLIPTRGSGERVTAVRCLDERDEAEFVVEELTTRRAQSSGMTLRDFAVVYRTNSQSRALEEALRKRAIAYRLVGTVRFYDRREVRDLMSYLKLIANPADDEAFRRAVAVPKRGLGETTIEQLSLAAREADVPMLAAALRPELLGTIRAAARGALEEFALLIAKFADSAKESAVDELLREVVDGIRYDEYLRAEGPESADRIENVRELITGAAEQVADEEGEVGLTPLDHFLQKAMLVAELDKLGPDADAVTLMTLHNAKGLEFPVVFITGLEDGLFPLAKAYEDPAMLEEERRLFYVGITRAERKLFLTHAEERRRNGEFMNSKASSFLQAIPEEMLEQRKTIKVRSSGRSFMQSLGGGSQWGNSRGRVGQPAREQWLDAESAFPPSASQRRPGTPVTRVARFDEAEVSQDAAVIVVGARVKHRKFGSGVIAELAGSGRDLKAKIDFDDETIGRKTLVVAQANLERDIE
jgi:DNA helicase-2/ATP-dependent DNA helicase PcrA